MLAASGAISVFSPCFSQLPCDTCKGTNRQWPLRLQRVFLFRPGPLPTFTASGSRGLVLGAPRAGPVFSYASLQYFISVVWCITSAWLSPGPCIPPRRKEYSMRLWELAIMKPPTAPLLCGCLALGPALADSLRPLRGAGQTPLRSTLTSPTGFSFVGPSVGPLLLCPCCTDFKVCFLSCVSVRLPSSCASANPFGAPFPRETLPPILFD